MSIHKNTERKIKEAYENFNQYLNDGDFDELYEMCNYCEKFCGIKEHDYYECINMPCFRCWLGLAYLDWSD